uniref:IQ motif and SEC7 domain-containing protein 2-like isoform X2 n=1 Tax=Myxine glutinosa TaxID=7769 RepID=UPI00358FE967
MLERKYGGHFITRRAACTIQSAFRHYQMNKNFERLRSCLSESRLPRRLTVSGSRKHLSHDETSVAGEQQGLFSFPALGSLTSLPQDVCSIPGGFAAGVATPSPLPPSFELDNCDPLAPNSDLEPTPTISPEELKLLSAPDDFADAISELEDSFARQVKSLADSIDDALSSRGSLQLQQKPVPSTSRSLTPIVTSAISIKTTQAVTITGNNLLARTIGLPGGTKHITSIDKNNPTPAVTSVAVVSAVSSLPASTITGIVPISLPVSSALTSADTTSFAPTAGSPVTPTILFPVPVATAAVVSVPVVATPVLTSPVATAPVAAAPVVAIPVVAAPVVTVPVVTAPVLTAPVLTAPVLTAPVPTAPVPTAPVPTAPVVTTPVVTTPVVSTPVLTAPVVTTTVVIAPVVTVPVTAAIVTAPVTTIPVATTPVTSSPVAATPVFTAAVASAPEAEAAVLVTPIVAALKPLVPDTETPVTVFPVITSCSVTSSVTTNTAVIAPITPLSPLESSAPILVSEQTGHPTQADTIPRKAVEKSLEKERRTCIEDEVAEKVKPVVREPCDLVRCASEQQEEKTQLCILGGPQRRVSCPECGGDTTVGSIGGIGGRGRLPLLTVEPASDSSLDGGSDRGDKAVLRRQNAHDQDTSLPNRGGVGSGSCPHADDVAPIIVVKRRAVRHPPQDPHIGINGGKVTGTRPSGQHVAHSDSDASDAENDNESVNSGNSNSNDTANCSSGSSSRDSLHDGSAAALSRPSYHREARHSWDSPAFSNDTLRKRHYRIGLNLFNKKPEKGIQFLVERGFVPDTPMGVAHFLLQRKGLSRQMIGEFLGNRQCQFHRDVLDCVVDEMDFQGMELDEALRKFQAHVRVQGEAQKVERLIEAFSQRFCVCNPGVVRQFQNPDTMFILAFAVVLLNTDMYSPNVKLERKMKLEDFVKNLRGVDDGADIPREMLVGIYERIRERELKTNEDHVSQVTKLEKSLVGKKPALSLTHRRLVCYCRLFEVPDPTKPQKLGLHQREIFLFNDLLVVSGTLALPHQVTKIFQRKKNSVVYSFRQAFNLYGMQVDTFENQFYPHGIKILSAMPRSDTRLLVLFNAPNAQDRRKFLEDLRESIAEVQDMEKYRIESELEKQRSVVRPAQPHRGSMRKEGRNGMTTTASLDDGCTASAGECLRRGTLSSSLRDLSEIGKRGRRGSSGSLDSNIEGSILGSPRAVRRVCSGVDASLMHRSTRPQGPTMGSVSLLGAVYNPHRTKQPGVPCLPVVGPSGHHHHHHHHHHHLLHQTEVHAVSLSQHPSLQGYSPSSQHPVTGTPISGGPAVAIPLGPTQTPAPTGPPPPPPAPAQSPQPPHPPPPPPPSSQTPGLPMHPAIFGHPHACHHHGHPRHHHPHHHRHHHHHAHHPHHSRHHPHPHVTRHPAPSALTHKPKHSSSSISTVV